MNCELTIYVTMLSATHGRLAGRHITQAHIVLLNCMPTIVADFSKKSKLLQPCVNDLFCQSVCVRHMNAALLVLRILPPPSSGALMLSHLHWSGAWSASYRRIALIIEFVIWKLPRAHVLKRLLERPVRQWIYFCGAWHHFIGFYDT